ncbi:MAG: AarF/ABC1/UbiB kinase family protein [Polyangiaceae bacterium]|nr:AarF/ABC1/UbiB kinase family protein [Myxococcales bacterium]MCB9590670.1 AarF/ABC1/UbiB kinase family protein [Polyangiaceae bacterium]
MGKRELDGIGKGWGRLLSTGKAASSAVRLAGAQILNAAPGKHEQLGELLAAELDQMKGMAMKVGQILSYMDGALPEEAQGALRKLQAGTRSVRFEVMQAAIEGSLGGTLEELFDSFEPEPIASASVGQVYRARFAGRDVAVKVQYPGIRDTIHADFSRFEGFSRIASLASAVDGPAIVSELRERFEEECDYRREAEWQNWFRQRFAAQAGVYVPEAIGERSSETVLTSEWAPGSDFYQFAAEADAARKQLAARTLLIFALRSLFELGCLNADPHPGNYLFPKTDRADQAVVFLDYGCVRRLDPDFVRHERRLFELVLENRRSDFEDAMLATGMIAKPKRFDFDFHWQLMCHQWAPYCGDHFEFTSEYIRAGAQYTGPSNPNLRLLAFPPQWIWVQRLVWGLHSVLTRLGARGNFGELARGVLGQRESASQQSLTP